MKDKEKDSSSFSGLLFGNVTTEGELDIEEDSFFDKQLKQDLDTFTKKSSFFNIKSLGVDRDDTTTNDGTVGPTGSIPASGGVDFEDIDELAEDMNTIENQINQRNADRLAKHAEENIAKLAERLKSNPMLGKFPIGSIQPGGIIMPPPPFKSNLIQKKKVEDDNFDEFDEQQEEKVKPIQQQKEKKKVEDLDFDQESEESEDEEEEEEVDNRRVQASPLIIPTTKITELVKESSSTSSSTQLDELQTEESIESKKKKPPRKFKTTINAVMEAMMDLLDDPYGVPSDSVAFKTLCSARTADGAIFKFSNLFAPKMPVDRPKKRHRRHKQPPHQPLTDDIVDIDEQTIFNKPHDSSGSSTSAVGLASAQSPTLQGKSMTMGVMGVDSKTNETEKREYNMMILLLHQQKQQQLQDEENLFEPLQERYDEESMQSFYQLPDSLFHNMSQLDWEDKIIWDIKDQKDYHQIIESDDNHQQKNQNNLIISRSIELQSFDQYQGKRKRWGDFEIIETPKESLKQKEKEKEFKSNIHGSWSLFPIRNRDLESGDWVNDIVWDESSTDYVPKVSSLILDLNDRDMMFDEHLVMGRELEQAAAAAAAGAEEQVPVVPPPPKKGRKKGSTAAAAAAAAAAANMSTSAAALQQQMSGLDKFNLSNDKFYRPLGRSRVRQQSGKALVTHSLPAIKLSLTKAHLTLDDLKFLHRPRIYFQPGNNFRIALFHKEMHREDSRGRRSDPSMKHKIDLSAREGRVVFVEYVEQYPLLINNVGMGSRIRNFYRRKNDNDAPFLSFEDGENVLLDANDESPFLGDIGTGQTVQAIVNNLYKSPIAKHNPSQTDFLLIRSRDGKKWYIREMGTMYTAGQQMPEVEVPAPNSRSANMFVKSRLQAYIFRTFLKKSNTQRRLKISDVCDAFPGQSEASIRKRLKDCSDFHRGGDDSGWWTAKDNFPLPTEEDLQKLVTPEMVCSYESMLIGLYLLQEGGIIHFTSPGTIPTMLSLRDANDPLRERVKPVEDELNRTPWNLTNSFVTAMQGKGKLQLVGEDPSAEDTFSYLKMPQKQVNQKQKEIKKMQQKNQVTGTDADLRKLSLKESETVLLQLGVSEETINSLSRWKRIALVRKKSSEAALTMGTDGAMTKFARGSRYSVDHQQHQYKEKCQGIFDNQMRSISGMGDEDDEMDLDDFEDLQKDIEEALGQQKSRTSSTTTRRNNINNNHHDDDEEIDEEEREEYNKLMNEMTDKNKKLDEIEKEKEKDETSTTTTSTTSTTSTTNLSNQLSTINESDEEMMESMSQLEPSEVEYIKRVTLFQKPDGGLYRRIEVIRDPAIIREYRRKRETLRKSGVFFEEEDLKRQRRKLQEKLRKLKTDPNQVTNMNQSTLNNSNNSQNIISNGGGGGGGLSNSYSSVAKIVYPTQEGSTTPSPSLAPKIKIPTNIVRNSIDGMDLDSNNIQSPSPLSHSQSIIVRIKKEDLTPISSSSSSIRRKMSSSSNRNDLDMMDMIMDNPALRQSTGRRTRIRKDGTGAEVELSNIFEKVIENLRSMPEFEAFRAKVKRHLAPDYHIVIKNPIDLTTMKERNRKWEYKSKQQFLDALQLMVDNCHEYNETRNPHLIPVVNRLYDVANQNLEEHLASIDNLEKSIKPNDSNPPTPIQSTPATPISPPINFSVESPFFPPTSKHEDEDIDIVSISGVSPGPN